MKIVMLSVMDDGKKIQLNPGMVVDTGDKKCPIDADEAQRLVDVGGARLQTKAEIAADLQAEAAAEQAQADAAKAAATAAGGEVKK